MTSQIEKMQARFTGMSTAQKKEFIKDMQQELKYDNSEEMREFLRNCVARYKFEAEEDKVDTPSPAPKAEGLGRVRHCASCGSTIDAGMAFCGKCGIAAETKKLCPKCGTRSSSDMTFCVKCGLHLDATICPDCSTIVEPNMAFCGKCGFAVDDNVSSGDRMMGETVAHRQVGYVQPNTNGIIESSGFMELLREYGTGGIFFLGFILYAVGNILSILINFSAFSIFSLGILALPVIGLWMLYNAVKSPYPAAGLLTSMTLFKVAAIIGLVLLCILLGLVALFGLGVIAGFGYFMGGEIGLLILLIFGVIVTGFVLWIKFYYIALLNVLKSIREGIMYGGVAEIKGAGSFVVLSFISIGLSIIGNLIMLVVHAAVNAVMQEMLHEVPRELRGMVSGLLPFGGTGFFVTILSLAGNVGLFLLILVLREFAIRIIMAASGQGIATGYPVSSSELSRHLHRHNQEKTTKY